MVVATLCPTLRAQDAAEREFFAEAAEKLVGFASQALQAGFPLRAYDTYREILAEYDPDDETARAGLGFVKLGSTWTRDTKHELLERERLDASLARRLSKKWKTVAKALAKGHRAQAKRLADDEQRAAYHHARVLRFEPGDADALEATGRILVEGIPCTPEEADILRRAQRIEQAMAEQLATDPRVELLPAPSLPALDAIGVEYIGVQSEHFTIFGTWDEPVLAEAAQNAERSLGLCRAIFADSGQFPSRLNARRTFVFCHRIEDWRELMRVNDRAHPPDVLKFILENVSSCALGRGPRALMTSGVGQEVSVQDCAVRWVAQNFTGFRAQALQEGIGHALNARLLGKLFNYRTGMPTRPRGTSARQVTAPPRPANPDLSSWDQTARENAWRDAAGVIPRELPLLTADRFTEEARIVAWSFVDFLLVRDPEFLALLDRTARERSVRGVQKSFAELTGGIRLEQLEAMWRDYCAGTSPVMRAIKGRPAPLDALEKNTTKWLDAFNFARAAVMRLVEDFPADDVQVGWSSELSADCRQHVEYLQANRDERGPAGEQTQDLSLEGATGWGRAFAQSALVSSARGDPRKILGQWLLWPGYRDALVNPNLDVVGLYADGALMAMDVTRGQRARWKGGLFYPTINNRRVNEGDYSVPHQVAVADLGPEVDALLEEAGIEGVKHLGYPLTLHLLEHQRVPLPETIRCTLTRGDEEVPGLLHIASGGSNRRTSAPGLVVFYPLEPLARGTEYFVQWEFGGQTYPAFPFTTQ